MTLTQVTHNGAHRLSPVDAPLLYCMNGSFRHRPAHASIALPSACVLTSAQATASSHGLGISVLYSHPYSHAVYASQCALPHTTQNSLPMLRLTAYRVGVSNPLCEAPLAGRTAWHHKLHKSERKGHLHGDKRDQPQACRYVGLDAEMNTRLRGEIRPPSRSFMATVTGQKASP